MKKIMKTCVTLLAFFSISISLACTKKTFTNQDEETIKPKEDPITEKVTAQIEALTLEEKIAQMLIVSFSNQKMDEELSEIIAKQPGGIILFKENITTFQDTKTLISNIKNQSKIVPFISIDQEGGKVERITNLPDKNVPNIPSMWDVGERNDEDYAYQIGKTIGQELQEFGINMNFAPVLDIVSNKNNKVIGNRSFGSNSLTVTKMGLKVAQGLKDNNIIPVFKHFPGHGSTITDSHYDLPVLNKTKEELLNSDIIPFKNAIDESAEVIMVGHLAVPNITNNNIPASLSKEIITNLLKQELGYEGLVITDALNMKAITKIYSEKEIYELAINAGVDILLMPASIESAISNIKESINEGTIAEEKINESVRKILSLKYRHNLS